MSALAMNSPTLAQRYFDAWNSHDAAALIGCFAPGGFYASAADRHDLTDAAIGAYARSLWEAFPDLHFELVSVEACGTNRVAAQWIMRGTNRGPFRGHAPTGRAIALPGADFIRLGTDGIRSVQGYFDSGAVLRQLDLTAAPPPAAIGPFSFGGSTRVQSGRRLEPGALTLTRLRAWNSSESEAIREAGWEIALDLLGRPGFIGMFTAAVGDELTAVAAWDSVDAVQQLRDARHSEVMAEFFGPELCSGGSTSLWVPARQNPRWVRCGTCGVMADSETGHGICGCGARLPEAACW